MLSRHHGSSQLTASEETIDRLKPQVGLMGLPELADWVRQNSEELINARSAASSAPGGSSQHENNVSCNSEEPLDSPLTYVVTPAGSSAKPNHVSKHSEERRSV